LAALFYKCIFKTPGRVIDLYQNPVLAKGEQIIAAPTLIKKLPLPLRKIIGNMSDKEKILVGLDLRARGQDNDDK